MDEISGFGARLLCEGEGSRGLVEDHASTPEQATGLKRVEVICHGAGLEFLEICKWHMERREESQYETESLSDGGLAVTSGLAGEELEGWDMT